MRPTCVAVVLLCGCSGSDGGSTVHGAVQGKAIHVVDCVSDTSLSNAMGYAEILMSTTPNICADAAANTTHANQTTVDILLADSSGSAVVPPSLPGTYSVGALPRRAVLIVRTFDAQCQVASTSMASATSGTVNLTRISGEAFTGTFDVILDTQDHLTGSFEPEECPSLAQIGSGTACM